MRTLVLTVAAVLAAPVFAQSDPEPVAPPLSAEIAVADTVQTQEELDAQLVGEWTLAEVAEAGRLGQLGVEVESMICAFRQEGTATVEMEMTQDLDPLTMERTFTYDTEDGQIVIDGDEPVHYQILADGRLEMATVDGLVVRLVRTRP